MTMKNESADAFVRLVGQLIKYEIGDSCLWCSYNGLDNNRTYRSGFFREFLKMLETIRVRSEDLDAMFTSDAEKVAWVDVRKDGEVSGWMGGRYVGPGGPCSFTPRRIVLALMMRLANPSE